MNIDISGIGFRISFYLQTLFLGFQAARSGLREDINGAEYTLTLTNIAMAGTALYLGLKPEPDISFHDALLILYLLAPCWVTNICLLAFIEGDAQILKLLSTIQSVAVFIFASFVIVTAPAFGSHPDCNKNAWMVFLFPIPVFQIGRILGGVACVFIMFPYICITVQEYIAQLAQPAGVTTPPDAVIPPNTTTPQADMPMQIPKFGDIEKGNLGVLDELNVKNDQRWKPDVDGPLTVQLLFILFMWVLGVMNTEYLIVRNRFEPSDTTWSFGQVLPLLLVVIPFRGMVKSFKTHGIWNVKHDGKGRRKDW
ncbi:hypothetical protein FIBSPDRAFT_944577 [Athelia psychrophila]|uniref:Uncharacterized protein n=1 Tax=Athelia psychrophila TaxID=1759441 RepID=A0A166USQ2_9AGAM|nr:hypothetical protein FIBSPDRAFT_944577 [Fibularhizoctonia sp. CBS 109695]